MSDPIDNRWRLLIVGAGAVAAEIAALAPRLGFAVSLYEPRADKRAAWPLPDSHWLEGDTAEAVARFAPDSFSALLALTHVAEIDDAALLAALPSEAFYVGAIGSRANAQARQERLITAGLAPAAVERLKAPIGLKIGSRTPTEIAISIVAELIAERSRVASEPGGPQCVANVS
jgi:xanthine dehydrogenase accessory factor